MNKVCTVKVDKGPGLLQQTGLRGQSINYVVSAWGRGVDDLLNRPIYLIKKIARGEGVKIADFETT